MVFKHVKGSCSLEGSNSQLLEESSELCSIYSYSFCKEKLLS